MGGSPPLVPYWFGRILLGATSWELIISTPNFAQWKAMRSWEEKGFFRTLRRGDILILSFGAKTYMNIVNGGNCFGGILDRLLHDFLLRWNLQCRATPPLAVDSWTLERVLPWKCRASRKAFKFFHDYSLFINGFLRFLVRFLLEKSLQCLQKLALKGTGSQRGWHYPLRDALWWQRDTWSNFWGWLG